MKHWFATFSVKVAKAAGSWQAFAAALGLVVGWLLAGFHYGFANELYNLAINSPTTCVSFLLGFIILNTTLRESAALHLKMDEMIRVMADARNDLIGAEEKTEDEIAALKIAKEGDAVC